MIRLKVLAATAILGAAMIGSAAAMPSASLAATAPNTSGIEHVRWVCGPFRCWWHPRPLAYRGYYNYYGPRWGWGGPFRRWW